MAITKEKFIELMASVSNWKKDRFGHFQCQGANGKTYRIKVQDLSCRIELKVYHAATQYSPASSSWVRIGGNYYRNITYLENGHLRVGIYVFKTENRVNG